jgi:DNA-binding transcriptional MerR regulator
MGAGILRWPITDFVAVVNAALKITGIRPAATRATDVLTERTIRYYTVVGLIDPPVGGPGVPGRYGRRHFLQVLAIKRRQSEGRSIRQLRADVAGARNTKLEKMARLPMPIEELERRAEELRTDRPVIAAVEPELVSMELEQDFDSGPPKPRASPMLLHAIYLPDGFVLLGPAKRLNRDDVHAVAVAVKQTLAERQVLHSRSDEPDGDEG